MLGTFLDKMSSFFDQRFMIACWTPIFIGLSLVAGVLGVLLGPVVAFGWWVKLGGPDQALLIGGALLGITLLGYLLVALTLPLVRLYEGYWSEGPLTQLARARQKQALKRAGNSPARDRNFPRNSKLLKPTRLGNLLATAEEYSYEQYRLDAVVWWPRLATLLPEDFRSQVDTALTPILTMLNLSMILSLLTVLGGMAALLVGQHWWLGVVIIIGGLLLARICYLAAVSQVWDYCILVRVAFDLYRHEVLKQMHIPLPDNLVEERFLWKSLNRWIDQYKPPWEENDAPRPKPFYYDIHQTTTSSSQPGGARNNFLKLVFRWLIASEQ
jgi:hypothetical protein